MCRKKITMKNAFTAAAEKLSVFKLPRYKDLPEIDLYMDQVISVSEKYLSALKVGEKSLITPSMINNYVKNGVIPPPNMKKYTRDHLAAIIIICSLKQTMEITDISVIINKITENRGMEQTFDSFAEIYESNFSSLVISADTASREKGESLYTIMVENAIISSAARTIVKYALSSLEEPAPKDPDPPKPQKKKKSKPEEIES